jgi:hypothetical protein
VGVAVELELVLYPASHPFGNSVRHSFASLFLRNPYAQGFLFLGYISKFFYRYIIYKLHFDKSQYFNSFND